jgi:predicted  nucleic acid-binding Zn-ribbon protein
MTREELPNQLETVLERARVVLHQEIENARAAVKALNAEKATAQATIAELQDRRASAQKQLDAVMKDLHRASTLAGINREITEARKTLEALKVETAEATTALEKLVKEQKEREARINALGLEANRLIAIRTEGEAAMADIRAKLAQVQLGARP